jgi:ribosomal protein S27AE
MGLFRKSKKEVLEVATLIFGCNRVERNEERVRAAMGEFMSNHSDRFFKELEAPEVTNAVRAVLALQPPASASTSCGRCHVLAPRGLGNALQRSLRLASPIRPPGG